MAKTPHVLVIEDDPVMQSLLRDLLVVNKFAVTLAADGLKALVMLESFTPDVILCDLYLPELDGMSFLKAIKELPKTAVIPVVILTQSKDAHDRVRGINVGARSYITKPFDVDDLVAQLREALKPEKPVY
jgi:two-component system NarL family response regulator